MDGMRHQPQGRAQIQTRYRRGLLAAFHAPNGPTSSLLPGQVVSVVSGPEPKRSATPAGVGASFAGSTRMTFAGTSGAPSTGSLTVLIVGRRNAASSIQILAARAAGAVSGGFEFGLYNQYPANPAKIYSSYNPGSGQTGISAGYVNGIATNLDGSFDTVTGQIYAIAARMDNMPACSENIALGATSNGFYLSGDVLEMFVWDWRSSVADLQLLSSAPWQVFESPELDEYRAASTVYILSATSGAFLAQAQSASLRASLRIDGGPVSFAFTGSYVRLSAARRLASEPAGFVLTPLATRLLATRRLRTIASALSMDVSAAALKAARRLMGSPGAVSMSGAEVKLAAARKLGAQPGAFTLAGAAATFVYTPRPGGQGPTYTLTGGAGAFLVSASAARLLLARRLISATGAFSAAGAPAVLVMARRLSSETGAFAIATAAGSLRVSRRLVAAQVSFSLAGSAVTFVYKPGDKPGLPTYTLTAVGGSLVMTGAAANLRVSRRLVAGPGQLALIGSQANLVFSQQIVYARAPAGSGYTPRTAELQFRHADATTARPAAIQRNNR